MGVFGGALRNRPLQYVTGEEERMEQTFSGKEQGENILPRRTDGRELGGVPKQNLPYVYGFLWGVRPRGRVFTAPCTGGKKHWREGSEGP